MFPALLDASDDPEFVQHRTLAIVYLYLVKRLDFQEFRRVRATRIAADLRMRPATAGQMLRILRDHGYLERGVRVFEVHTYRMMYSRRGSEPSEARSSERAPHRNLSSR